MARSGQVPDLILADYQLNRDDTGLRTIKAVREDSGEDISAVVVTAYRNAGMARSCARLSIRRMERLVRSRRTARRLAAIDRRSRMSQHPISLRLRLSAGAGALATLAILAAFLAIYGVRQALWLGEDAALAQRRIDAYSTLSARVTEVVLTPASQRGAAVSAVLDEFGRLDQMIGADVVSASSEAAQRRAAQGAALGRMQGAFLMLTRDLDAHAADPARRDAAVNVFAQLFSPLMRDQIEYNSLRGDAALAALDRLCQHMLVMFTALVLSVGAVLVLLYLLVIAPLMGRRSSATRMAALGKTDAHPTLLPRGARDELGLLFARINWLIVKLDRRRAAVAPDHATLETVVADRTAVLEVVNARLSRIDGDRRRFFADVSHELRTALTGIMAEAELAAADCPPGLRKAWAPSAPLPPV